MYTINFPNDPSLVANLRKYDRRVFCYAVQFDGMYVFYLPD